MTCDKDQYRTHHVMRYSQRSASEQVYVITCLISRVTVIILHILLIEKAELML